MTLLRTIAVLGGGLVLLLAVVIQRAETTRLHSAVAKCEREADELRQQLTETEMELARLRNPMGIRQRMEQTVGQLGAEEPKPAEPPRRRSRR